VDGEAEERMELNSASLLISVSPLMVGRGCGNLGTQMLRKAHARDAPVVQQILFASIWYCQRVERVEEILRREVYHVVRFNDRVIRLSSAVFDTISKSCNLHTILRFYLDLDPIKQ
jgi:hypothetical protein